MKTTPLSRRGLLQGALAAATVTILPSRVFGANDRVNLAGIGCGGKGGGDLDDASRCGANIVALCDVDDRAAAGSLKRWPNAKRYKDFRKMLDEMDKEIDAVTVSTPDHMHYPGAMCAMLHGKHAFVQKPMTHNVWEAKRLAQVAREKKLASLMGIQGHANEGPRLLSEWLQAGLIGNVTEVHYCTDRPGGWWPQGGVERPKDTPPAPKELDWDLWLGVAPERPYHPCYLPIKWRGWWDFGCGALGDIGCHVMDAAFWVLNLGEPLSIEAEVSELREETGPKWSIITYQFPARGDKPPVKVMWHDGGKQPPRPKDLEPDRKLPNETWAVLYGEKGTILQDFYCSSVRIIPEAKHRELDPTKVPKTLPRPPKGHAPHMQEFIRACKGGEPGGANFEYAAALTTMVLLGNLAVRTGKKIEWDAKTQKATNVPEVNKYLSRVPRKGWEDLYKGL
ncbi:MAG: Gfo/Idh/MocA family oxidoreductase [Planctomycetota bacterium]|nr:Gfo/Idh/MocA family oxidoreductase [Planctomycetota bacterium]